MVLQAEETFQMSGELEETPYPFSSAAMRTIYVGENVDEAPKDVTRLSESACMQGVGR